MSRWSDEETSRLTELWAAGYSANKIACALGNGYTRLSVIGKVHRLGLPARDTTTRYIPGYKPGAFKLKPKKAADLAEVKEADAPVPLGEPGELSTKGCKWPMHADGQPWRNCGHERFGKTVWCSFHAARGIAKSKANA